MRTALERGSVPEAETLQLLLVCAQRHAYPCAPGRGKSMFRSVRVLLSMLQPSQLDNQMVGG